MNKFKEFVIFEYEEDPFIPVHIERIFDFEVTEEKIRQLISQKVKGEFDVFAGTECYGSFGNAYWLFRIVVTKKGTRKPIVDFAWANQVPPRPCRETSFFYYHPKPVTIDEMWSERTNSNYW